MNIKARSPLRSLNVNNNNLYLNEPKTPQVSLSLSRELKKVLNERNLLTTKTRRKVCSMLDNLTPLERNELDKRRSLRLQAMEEILTSEKSYLRQLEVLMKFFVIPLKEKGIIHENIHTALFGQIEMIYNLNGELLKELEDDLENVANAFLKLAPFFKLYSVYAFDYKNAILILQDLSNKNFVFRKFLEDTESRPEVQKKLNAFMIVPIQRVPRYLLLLKQVILYTSPADPDFKLLQDSIKQVESTVSHINSVIEDQEVTQVLLNLQNSLLNRTPNIVKPSRKIIKEGPLNKVTRNGVQVKRYCILMSDIFMYCKLLKDRSKNTIVENSLECCCIFPLKKCKVYDIFPGNFKITCQGDGIILCTSDYHVSQSWVASIKDTIEMHIQCRKTLRKESSKRAPMRKKDIKNFDVDHILSPNKRKCDYESVFRCGVSSDSEQEDSSGLSCFGRKNRTLKKNNEKLQPNNKENETCEQTDSNELTFFKKPYTPCNVAPQMRAKLPPIIGNLKKFQPEDTPCEDLDPTYGFANRFSHSKSYVRTHSVDSNISTSNISTFEKEAENENERTPIMDTLYPLRVSTGSSKSNSSWLHTRNSPDEPANTNKLREETTNRLQTYPRKRVKFEDMESISSGSGQTFESSSRLYQNKPIAFQFNNMNGLDNNNRTSLRSRILDFFSRLF